MLPRRWPAGWGSGCCCKGATHPPGAAPPDCLLTLGPWAPPFLRGSCLRKGGAVCRLLEELSRAVCRSCCWHRYRGSNLAPCTGQPPPKQSWWWQWGGAGLFLASVCAGHTAQVHGVTGASGHRAPAAAGEAGRLEDDCLTRRGPPACHRVDLGVLGKHEGMAWGLS